jgi:hypothetical protein
MFAGPQAKSPIVTMVAAIQSKSQDVYIYFLKGRSLKKAPTAPNDRHSAGMCVFKKTLA